MADTEDSRAKKREYNREYQRKRRAENPGEQRAYQQAWRAKNPEKTGEYHRDWRAKNPERDKAQQAAWAAQNPEKSAYLRHRTSATQRNIPFLLTYEEWLKTWEDSGHLEERGSGKEKYCMARHGDVGPYAIGNVRICTNDENAADKRGRRLSEAHRKALSKAWQGRRLNSRNSKGQWVRHRGLSETSVLKKLKALG